MAAIVLNGKRLALAPRPDAWQVGLLPIEEGRPGQEGVIALETAHAGYGDSDGRFPGSYDYAVDLDARRPMTLSPTAGLTYLALGGTANTAFFFDLGGYTYAGAGRYVFRIDPATNAVATSHDLGAGRVARSAALWNGKGYVADGNLHEVTPGGVWTSTTIAADVLAVGLGALYRAVGAQVSKCAADPKVDANWSAFTTIGDPSVPITAMAEVGRYLLIAKEDGLWGLDADFTAANLVPELAAHRHADNGKSMRVWHGLLAVPHQQGLFGWQPGAVQLMGPETLLLNRSPARGQVTALAAAGQWLYAALWAGSETYILAGRERDATTPGLGPLVWHTLRTLAARCDALHVSGITSPPRLYLGHGADAAYLVVDDAQVGSSGSIYWGWLDGRLPRTRKLLRSVEFTLERPSSVAEAHVYLASDSSDWQWIGKAARRGYVAVACPFVPAAFGRRFRLRLELRGSATVRMPIFLRYVASPSVAHVYRALVMVGRTLPSREATALMETLRAWQQPHHEPLPLITPDNEEVAVQLTDVSLGTADWQDAQSALVAITMREVDG